MDRDRSGGSEFFVCYSYGQGGLWAIVRADSADRVKDVFPDVDVFPQRPDWMTSTDEAELRSLGVSDADDRDSWFSRLMALEGHAHRNRRGTLLHRDCGPASSGVSREAEMGAAGFAPPSDLQPRRTAEHDRIQRLRGPCGPSCQSPSGTLTPWKQHWISGAKTVADWNTLSAPNPRKYRTEHVPPKLLGPTTNP